MRRAARVDDNQLEIVRALRKAGASVAITSAVGDGFTDLVVGYAGATVLVEVKDGTKPPCRRRLTPDEDAFHRAWRDAIAVVESIDDALVLLGDLTHRRMHG